jgi:hypothetical protein
VSAFMHRKTTNSKLNLPYYEQSYFSMKTFFLIYLVTLVLLVLPCARLDAKDFLLGSFQNHTKHEIVNYLRQIFATNT